jgi:hypothetical protein
VGVYRSSDGGKDWIRLGATTFNGLRIRSIIATRETLSTGEIVLAATTDTRRDSLGNAIAGGVYESNDSGKNWVRLSGASGGLPNIGVSQLIADPNSDNVFYTATEGGANGAGAGVYKITISIQNNVATTTVTNLTGDLPKGAFSGEQLQLSVSKAGMFPLYLAAITPNGSLQGVYWLNTKGLSPPNSPIKWHKLGTNPPAVYNPGDNEGGQGGLHLSIVADPSTANLVYVGGDALPAANGPYSGNIARGNSTDLSWTSEVFYPTMGMPSSIPGKVIPTRSNAASAPHADSRVMVFDGANTILEGDDGGIYLLTNADGASAAPVWTSVNGNLANTELYSATFGNSGGPKYLGAAQDNSAFTARLNAKNETVWSELWSGDGIAVLADPVHHVSYATAQYFSLVRLDDSAGNPLIQFPQGAIVGTTDRFLNGSARGLKIESLPFYTAVALNSSGSMLVGGHRTLYLSTDEAETFTSLGGLNATKTGANPVPEFQGTVTAIAYGDAANPNIAYVADSAGNIYVSSNVFPKPEGGPTVPFLLTNFDLAAWGHRALGITIDPNNPDVAYAVTSNGVYMTTDRGIKWTSLTGNLLDQIQTAGSPSLGSRLECITMVKNVATGTDALLVGGLGGVFRLSIHNLTAPSTPTWFAYGQLMPDVLVQSLAYRPGDHQLLASTLGRGIWLSDTTNSSLADQYTLEVIGADPTVIQDPNNPRNWLVKDGNGNIRSIPKSEVQSTVLLQ